MRRDSFILGLLPAARIDRSDRSTEGLVDARSPTTIEVRLSAGMKKIQHLRHSKLRGGNSDCVIFVSYGIRPHSISQRFHISNDPSVRAFFEAKLLICRNVNFQTGSFGVETLNQQVEGSIPSALTILQQLIWDRKYHATAARLQVFFSILTV